MEAQREWLEKDYYKILGVDESASEVEITKAYRKLAKKLHPDANPGDTSAEDQFKEVSAAYDVIGNEATRQSYDEVRRLGPIGAGGFPGGGFSGQTGGFRVNFNGQEISDLLGGMFGGGRSRRPHRGDDLETELNLDFAAAVFGTTATVTVYGDASCESCGGSGAAKGTKPVKCSECAGSGMVEESQGHFLLSRPCGSCGGRGHRIKKPCSDCGGRGGRQRAREITARIPAGVSNGQRIRLKRKGALGENGGPPGDLYVLVRVRPHELFKREGKNVTLAVPVTFAEAALGADVKVPTLNGGAVTIRIPAGTSTGKRLKVSLNGSKSSDLIIVVDVEVPNALTDAQKQAVQAYADATQINPRAHLNV